MGIDKLSVLTMILHTCTHTAPHGLVRSRVVAIVARTSRCEIHITAMFRMLGREDMIEGGQFEEVGITGLRVATMQILRQLQHVVRVTALRTVDIRHEVLTSLLAGEVLTTAIAAECQ